MSTSKHLLTLVAGPSQFQGVDRILSGKTGCCHGKLPGSPSLPSHLAAWAWPLEETEEGRPQGQEGGTGPAHSCGGP